MRPATNVAMPVPAGLLVVLLAGKGSLERAVEQRNEMGSLRVPVTRAEERVRKAEASLTKARQRAEAREAGIKRTIDTRTRNWPRIPKAHWYSEYTRVWPEYIVGRRVVLFFDQRYKDMAGDLPAVMTGIARPGRTVELA